MQNNVPLRPHRKHFYSYKKHIETETVLNGTTKITLDHLLKNKSAGVTMATQTSIPFPTVTLRVFQLTVRCLKSQLRRERHMLKLLEVCSSESFRALHFCSSPNSSVMSHHITATASVSQDFCMLSLTLDWNEVFIWWLTAHYMSHMLFFET